MKTQRVLERLIYEGILFHNQFQGRRWPLELKDYLEAGRQEPRILEVLPAILKLRPNIIRHWKRDLPKYSQLNTLVKQIDQPGAPKLWKSIPIQNFRQQLEHLNKLWEFNKRKNRFRNLNLRVSEEDLRKLEELSRRLGQPNKSEIVRDLIQKA